MPVAKSPLKPTTTAAAANATVRVLGDEYTLQLVAIHLLPHELLRLCRSSRAIHAATAAVLQSPAFARRHLSRILALHVASWAFSGEVPDDDEGGHNARPPPLPSRAVRRRIFRYGISQWRDCDHTVMDRAYAAFSRVPWPRLPAASYWAALPGLLISLLPTPGDISPLVVSLLFRADHRAVTEVFLDELAGWVDDAGARRRLRAMLMGFVVAAPALSSENNDDLGAVRLRLGVEGLLGYLGDVSIFLDVERAVAALGRKLNYRSLSFYATISPLPDLLAFLISERREDMLAGASAAQLILASSYRNPAAMQSLKVLLPDMNLVASADIELAIKIHNTLQGGFYEEVEGVVHLAMHHSVDTDNADVVNIVGHLFSPRQLSAFLIRAARFGNFEVIESLLSAGADVNASDGQGWTPLHYVTNFYDSLEGARLLRKHGAELEIRGEGGVTAFHECARWGSPELVQFFLQEGADLHETTDDGRCPIHMAAMNSNHCVIRELLSRGASLQPRTRVSGDTPLHFAVTCRRDSAKALLDAGADINCTNNYGRTPIHALLGAVGWSSIEEPILQLLIERGADLEARDSDGETPLYKAARSGWPRRITPLLARRVDVEVSNRWGNRPMHAAAQTDSASAIALLATRGAAVSPTNNIGRTPLHDAAANAYSANTVRELLRRGANLHAACVSKGSGPGCGAQPLHEAARSGRLEVLRALLDAGADIAARDADGNSPLHIAVSSGRGRSIATRELLARGADLTARNARGLRPVDLALGVGVAGILAAHGS
ncbi:Ankyrin repeat and SOCS box protein 10 [Cladochytrium tenue]|nr:Ankyrin repeat and SOCS box protein 10 [Cladochytrium tenue]